MSKLRADITVEELNQRSAENLPRPRSGFRLAWTKGSIE